MKHKAAIHLQITMFSCLNGHHACAGWKKKKKKKLTRAGGVRDEERGTETERDGERAPGQRRVIWGEPLGPRAPFAPRTQGLTE